MESIGTYLRREREQRGIGLEEIADTTRIPLGSLEQLESGDYTALPGETFVKGFLRSYARALGVSTDEVLARYAVEIRAREVVPVPVRLPASEADRGRRFGLAIALVVFGILATLAMSFLLRPRTQDRPEQLSLRAASVSSTLSG
ncbi:MAG: helix-turn-helix domain-containing protein [Myxococcales bacterium]|nr:helix-turn-helix domain-containing protein [Myxococcales bacterium]